MALNSSRTAIREAIDALRRLKPALTRLEITSDVGVDPTPLTTASGGEALTRATGGAITVIAYVTEIQNDIKTFIEDHWTHVFHILNEATEHTGSREQVQESQDAWNAMMGGIWDALTTIFLKTKNAKLQYQTLWYNYVTMQKAVDESLEQLEALMVLLNSECIVGQKLGRSANGYRFRRNDHPAESAEGVAGFAGAGEEDHDEVAEGAGGGEEENEGIGGFGGTGEDENSESENYDGGPVEDY
jgi:hypothetical protein